MKKIIKLPLIALLLCTMFLHTQAQDKFKYTKGDFHQLNIEGPFRITLIKGVEKETVIELYGFDKEDIDIINRNGELSFELESKWNFNRDYNKNNYIKVTLYYQELDKIDASMGAIVKSNDVLSGDELEIDFSMGAEAELQLSVNELDLQSNMGSVVQLAGKAERMYVSCNMGGVINAEELTTKNAYAKCNMGGVIKLNATEELESQVNFGGEIYYWGNPKRVDNNTAMGGSIINRSKEN